jgi:hypothetical protein
MAEKKNKETFSTIMVGMAVSNLNLSCSLINAMVCISLFK